jgi:hypothetical protein
MERAVALLLYGRHRWIAPRLLSSQPQQLLPFNSNNNSNNNSSVPPSPWDNSTILEPPDR